ncbi:MAG: hypothetical protein GWP50_11115, partial [Proteobacteria bacterium]|nr:hypothetical protein [Pseudomonadota bacterium]
MLLNTIQKTSMPRLPRAHSLEALPPKVQPPKLEDGSFDYPPLFLHPDPLANSLLARAGGQVNEETLKAAMLLNSTRIATILRTWFPPSAGQPGRVSRQDFLDVVGILGLPNA